MNVTVIDYGLGNLWSVKSALEFIGAQVTISGDPDAISRADALILPGVGSFGTGMANLHAKGLVDALNHAVAKKGTPILGICLGMQLLADRSEEAPGFGGLGWISGDILRFRDKSLRLPHIGFNAVSPLRDGDFFRNEKAEDFYFVHSYYFSPVDNSHALASTSYGIDFVSAVKRDNIVGAQFHPEKSQSNGLRFLSDFIKFSSAA